jgi:hypothetical protein
MTIARRLKPILLGLLAAVALLRFAACSDDVPDTNIEPVNLEPSAIDAGDASFSSQFIDPIPPNPH